MSQANSEFDFDEPEFAATVESDYNPDQASPATAEPAIRYRKQGFSIYTILLILSFLAMTTALIILFVDAGKYT